MDNKEIMPWMERFDTVNVIIKDVVKVWLSAIYTEKSRSKLWDNFTESHRVSGVGSEDNLWALGSVI